jgi:thiamine biosynthesis protein ThiS
MITVTLNGEPRELPAPCTVRTLMESMGLPPETLLVEHNGSALLRSEWDTRPVHDGDSLLVLRVAAGG